MQIVGAPSSLNVLEDDKGEVMAKSVQECMRNFATTADGAVDNALYQHMVQHVHSIFADGAVQKTLALLQVALPNVAIVNRDTCHVQRIATGDPLKRDAVFGERWKQIMAGQGGLFPAIRSSFKWQAELVSAQRFMRVSGKAGLDSILKQVGHADARWESSASSSRHYVCMQSAIALLLAMRAQDERLSRSERAQAASWLEQMGPSSTAEAGLTADWTAEALAYIRKDDRCDPDVALVSRSLDEYLTRVHKLFVEGRILLRPDDTDDTFIARSIRNARECPAIYYGDKVKYLWDERSGGDACVLALHHMREIAKDATERLQAEIGENLVADFAAFDLLAWREAFSKRGDEQLLAVKNLCRRYQRLLQARGCNVLNNKSVANKEISAAARVLLADNQDQVAHGVDNREVWAQIASESFPSKCGFESFLFLDDAVDWYCAVEHVSTSCERDLGQAKKAALAHSGPLEDLSAILHAILDGPRNEEDVVIQEQHQLGLTDWSRQWAQLWLELRGRRFLSYRRRLGPEPVGKKKMRSDLEAKRSQKRAADSLVALSSEQAKRRRIVLPSARKLQVDVGLEVSKQTEQFRKHTIRRKDFNVAKRQKALVGDKASMLPPVREATLFTDRTTSCSKSLDSWSLASQQQLAKLRLNLEVLSSLCFGVLFCFQIHVLCRF